MFKRWTAACCAVALAASIGCGEAGDDSPDQFDGTGAAIAVQLEPQSDVEYMEYTITECGEEEPLMEPEQKALKEDMSLPGDLPSFVDNPFDEYSEHLFADYFVVLDAGCYDVHVQPLDGHQQPSEDCIPVQQQMEVVDGKTTEEVLISQCAGTERGALDVIAALNHPPEIDVVDLDPQKFLSCPAEGNPTVEVCAQAQDPDQDPMIFDWGDIEDIEGVENVSFGEFTSVSGIANQCLDIEFARTDDQYEVTLTVFDTLIELYNGERTQQTFEDWFADRQITDPKGNPIESRASLTFPLYVAGCDEPFACPRTIGTWRQRHNWDELLPEGTDFDYDTTALCDGQNGDLWSSVMFSPGQFQNQYYNLARQYAAAALNREAGATVPSEIDDLIDEAAELLNKSAYCEQSAGQRQILSEDQQRAGELQSELDDYNNLCSNSVE